MAKISLDVNEIKKNLKATALTAKEQLTELAKKAQKDFSQGEVLKKIDQVVEIVKSQEFMKNPKVVEITNKILTLSEQLEKTINKNTSTLVDQVRSKVNAAQNAASATSAGAAKKKSSTKKATKKNGSSQA